VSGFYYMPVKKKVYEGITTYVAFNAKGERAVAADGATKEQAAAILRSCARSYMEALAEQGHDPLSRLHFGEPKGGCLALTEQDLFPVVLRYLRMSRGFTQAQVAEMIGKDQPAYSRLESHKANPSVETCVLISKAFGTTVHQEIYRRQGAA